MEVSGTAFGMAYARGRYGDEKNELNVGGVPVGLITGVGGHLLGFIGVFGQYGEHVHNIGDGALAEYVANLGNKIGTEHRDATMAASGRYAVGRRHAVGGYNQRPAVGAHQPSGTYQGWGTPAAYARARGGVAM